MLNDSQQVAMLIFSVFQWRHFLIVRAIIAKMDPPPQNQMSYRWIAGSMIDAQTDLQYIDRFCLDRQMVRQLLKSLEGYPLSQGYPLPKGLL